MHAGAGFSDDALLAHALGKQRLADRIVDLVCTGMVEVFALEVNLRAAAMLGQALGVIDRAGAPDVVFQFIGEFGLEFGIIAEMQVLAAQFIDRRDQRFRHVDTAKLSEMPLHIGKIILLHELLLA